MKTSPRIPTLILTGLRQVICSTRVNKKDHNKIMALTIQEFRRRDVNFVKMSCTCGAQLDL